MDQKGYFGTGISQIISLAEIPKGSFYHYFDSKEAFTIEIINFYAIKIIANIQIKLENKDLSPVERIVDLYKDYSENVTNINKSPNGGFASKISQEAGEESEKIKNASTNVYSSIRNLHAICIDEAIKMNQLSPEIDSAKLANLIIYGWEGAIMRMKGSKNIESLKIFTEMLEKVILK